MYIYICMCASTVDDTNSSSTNNYIPDSTSSSIDTKHRLAAGGHG